MGNNLLRGITILMLAIYMACGGGLVPPFATAQSLPETQETVSKATADSNVFSLGEIEVKDSREVNRFVTSDKVTNEEMRLFNTDRLPDALDLLPGVTTGNSGNRNEKRVFIRGFGTTQVPVFMDGFPVYMSYDRSFDFNRFTTFDLSEIVVTKGFTSVLYGPNTMGGAINMISRKPVKAFEGDVGAGYGTGNAWNAYANLGSKHEKWYLREASPP